MVPKTKWVKPVGEQLGNKALALIESDFPYLLDDIKEYAKKNNVDVGTIAAYAVADIILPTVQKEK